MQTDKMITKKIDVSLICRFHVFFIIVLLIEPRQHHFTQNRFQ